ncbi:2-oxoglutarate receptor 1-like [Pezoporus wallicus]|uniref:2-oxoglutarate receptor 1-like n=1 Tax=Pezoporus wallicus TaxID=35540 RepID=UPI00254B79EC|nr:2-oxoglutarate receptor 1-like [Pezoporus wallicus]XP_061332225.1 2-oxoglutarate receptor 1-like [Pezoporus flaviventris]
MASEHTSNFTTQPGHTDPFTTCKNEDFSEGKYYLTAFYSLIFVLCFPANIMTIFVYFVKMRPWKSSTIIMFNLAITDLLYLATLPFFIHYSFNGNNWIFGDFLCKFIHFGFNFNMYSGIIFLSCFSVLRFFVVVYPIKFFFVKKRRWAVVTSVVVWMISLATISPLGILIATRHTQNKTICPDLSAAADLETSRWYNWLLMMFAFLLPLITVTLCYVLIIYTLATGPHTQACYKQKARRLAIVILVLFYACFLPFHIFRGIRLEIRARPVSCHLNNLIHNMYNIVKPLAALNTIANLLFYVVTVDNFQKAVLSLLKLLRNRYLKRLMP